MINCALVLPFVFALVLGGHFNVCMFGDSTTAMWLEPYVLNNESIRIERFPEIVLVSKQSYFVLFWPGHRRDEYLYVWRNTESQTLFMFATFYTLKMLSALLLKPELAHDFSCDRAIVNLHHHGHEELSEFEKLSHAAQNSLVEIGLRRLVKINSPLEFMLVTIPQTNDYRQKQEKVRSYNAWLRQCVPHLSLFHDITAQVPPKCFRDNMHLYNDIEKLSQNGCEFDEQLRLLHAASLSDFAPSDASDANSSMCISAD